MFATRPLVAAILFACALGACSSNHSDSGTREAAATQWEGKENLPMYGGLDRTLSPAIKAADERFVAEAVQIFGSREIAARRWVAQGFVFQQHNDLSTAMRRFNEAWLLDPKNPEVYYGFGMLLHDQGSYCEAMVMMNKALALNPPTFQGIYPDAARTIALCSATDQWLPVDAKVDLFERSQMLYKAAEQLEPNKGDVYVSWANAYYWRRQYAEAWAMVHKARAHGADPGEAFMRRLEGKMSESSAG